MPEPAEEPDSEVVPSEEAAAITDLSSGVKISDGVSTAPLAGPEPVRVSIEDFVSKAMADGGLAALLLREVPVPIEEHAAVAV